MKKKAIVTILLCLCLVFAMTGCQENNSPETTPPPTTVPQTTAPPTTAAPDPLELYNEAVSAIPEDLTMDVKITRQVTVAGSVYKTESQQTITYLGYGTDALTAAVEETVLYGDYSADCSETFLDGTVYANLSGEDFAAALTAEDFSARYIPAVLLDGSIYSDVVMEDNVFTFSGAAAPESWLLDEEVDTVEATGTVTVADGVISAASYSVSYTLGGSAIDVTVEQTISAPKDASITPPADAESYLLIESIDAPKLLDQVYGLLLQTPNVTAVVTDSTASQAAAYLLNTQTIVNSHVTGEDPVYKVEQSFYEISPNASQPAELKMEEIFQNGKYTSSTDGGRAQPDSTVTADGMKTYVQGILTGSIPETSSVGSAVLTDVGGILLAEFTGTEQAAEDICATLCSNLFGSATLLNDLATAYQTNIMDFYVAVDRYTGLPTAMGIQYEGCHTIDGMQYLLTGQTDYSLDLGALEAYKEVTDEVPPETEPEQKATPLLYHVTGDKGQEMWLIGTIHVGEDRTGFLPQELYDAFAASDALAIECDNTGFEEQLETDDALSSKVSGLYYYSDGTTVKDHFEDPELYEKALQKLKATGNYNMNSLYMKPVFLSQSIDNSLLSYGHQLTSCKGLESRLEDLAKQQNKPIREVESNIFQIEMQVGYSEALQEMMVADSVEATSREYWESVQELYDLWCQGDEAALIEALTEDTSELTEEEKALYEEYDKAISYDRNIGMLEVAKEYLESGDTVFYAVGLAHLLAENGLVFTLREAGYTVELVTYN